MTDLSRDELFDIINKCIFFSALPEEQIIKLEPHFEKMMLSAGEILFRQGERPWDVFILIKGKLLGLLETKNNVQVINTMIPIETIGELGVISGEPRSLTIRAVVNSELLRLPGEFFIELCRENPRISLEIMRLISQRSIKTIKLISEIKAHKLLIFFAANKRVHINQFIDNIKRYHHNFSIKFFDYEQSEIEKHLKTLTVSQAKNESIAIVIKKYEHKLFKLFEENQSHFFLVGEAEDFELDFSAKSIINHILHYHHAINEPNFHYNLQLVLLQYKNTLRTINTKRWLETAKFHLHHHIRENEDNDLQRFLRFATGNAVGLVLGGGGLRAFCHLGVIKALEENNIPIDIIGGTSSGACVGAYYIITHNYTPSHEIISQVTGAIRQSLSLKHLTWLSASLFNGDPCTTMMQEIFGNYLIEDLWSPFFCVSANLSSIKHSEMIHRSDLVWEALRSSSAVPGLLPPVVLNGALHYDGALINNLPVDVMRAMLGSNGKIIASQLSYVAKDKNVYSFPPVIKLKDIILHKLGFANQEYRFPNFFEIFFDALLLSANFREEQNSTQADLLVRPNLSGFGMFKLSKKQELQLFEIGYMETLKALQEFNFMIVK